MQTTFRRAAGAALLLTAALTGCSENNGTTQLSIKLKDAPGDVQAAVVTITRIELQGEGGTQVLLSGADSATVDLTDLVNQATDLVKDAVVPSGSYSQLRFVISGAALQVDNGDGTSSVYATDGYTHLPNGATAATGTLQAPSFSTSGLKVNLPGGSIALEGDQKILLVDFDVSRSFGHESGAAGRWTMHPVLTATDFQATAGAHVAVQTGPGVTLPTGTTLAAFDAVLVQSGTTDSLAQPLADANADGTFDADFSFVAPGTYAVSLRPHDAASTLKATLDGTPSLTVASGAQANATVTVTGVQ
jgi:Domain of unknown function (DUF4382)